MVKPIVKACDDFLKTVETQVVPAINAAPPVKNQTRMQPLAEVNTYLEKVNWDRLSPRDWGLSKADVRTALLKGGSVEGHSDKLPGGIDLSDGIPDLPANKFTDLKIDFTSFKNQANATDLLPKVYDNLNGLAVKAFRSTKEEFLHYELRKDDPLVTLKAMTNLALLTKLVNEQNREFTIGEIRFIANTTLYIGQHLLSKDLTPETIRQELTPNIKDPSLAVQTFQKFINLTSEYLPAFIATLPGKLPIIGDGVRTQVASTFNDLGLDAGLAQRVDAKINSGVPPFIPEVAATAEIAIPSDLEAYLTQLGMMESLLAHAQKDFSQSISKNSDVEIQNDAEIYVEQMGKAMEALRSVAHHYSLDTELKQHETTFQSLQKLSEIIKQHNEAVRERAAKPTHEAATASIDDTPQHPAPDVTATFNLEDTTMPKKTATDDSLDSLPPLKRSASQSSIETISDSEEEMSADELEGHDLGAQGMRDDRIPEVPPARPASPFSKTDETEDSLFTRSTKIDTSQNVVKAQVTWVDTFIEPLTKLKKLASEEFKLEARLITLKEELKTKMAQLHSDTKYQRDEAFQDNVRKLGEDIDGTEEQYTSTSAEVKSLETSISRYITGFQKDEVVDTLEALQTLRRNILFNKERAVPKTLNEAIIAVNKQIDHLQTASTPEAIFAAGDRTGKINTQVAAMEVIDQFASITQNLMGKGSDTINAAFQKLQAEKDAISAKLKAGNLPSKNEVESINQHATYLEDQISHWGEQLKSTGQKISKLLDTVFTDKDLQDNKFIDHKDDIVEENLETMEKFASQAREVSRQGIELNTFIPAIEKLSTLKSAIENFHRMSQENSKDASTLQRKVIAAYRNNASNKGDLLARFSSPEDNLPILQEQKELLDRELFSAKIAIPKSNIDPQLRDDMYAIAEKLQSELDKPRSLMDSSMRIEASLKACDFFDTYITQRSTTYGTWFKNDANKRNNFLNEVKNKLLDYAEQGTPASKTALETMLKDAIKDFKPRWIGGDYEKSLQFHVIQVAKDLGLTEVIKNLKPDDQKRYDKTVRDLRAQNKPVPGPRV